MKQVYSFKRGFYYEMVQAVEQYDIVFLVGPRTTGKTVCLRQLAAALQGIYTDVKRDLPSQEDSLAFVDHLIEEIYDDRPVLHLIDELSYLFLPDLELCRIADAWTEVMHHRTKLVFSGGPARALHAWGYKAFAGSAKFIESDFLSYPEWLAYKGRTDVTEETYVQFLTGARDFASSFTNTADYLRSCLDEIAYSNLKSRELISNNDCALLTVDMLLDVLYASLVSSHNRAQYDTLSSPPHSQEDIAYRQIADRMAVFLRERYKNYARMPAYELKKALQFLQNCRLITLTYVTSDFETPPYVSQQLLDDFRDTPEREDFDKFHICIRYPMFYVDLLREVLQDSFPEELPRDLLGSIAQCHVRAVLPDTGCFAYHDAEGREIDYVSNNKDFAVAISVSNLELRDTHFSLLPDWYRRILLTRDIQDSQGLVERIPYYRFIYDRSTGHR